MGFVKRRPSIAALATAVALSSCMLVPALAAEPAAEFGVVQEQASALPTASDELTSDISLEEQTQVVLAGEEDAPCATEGVEASPSGVADEAEGSSDPSAGESADAGVAGSGELGAVADADAGDTLGAAPSDNVPAASSGLDAAASSDAADASSSADADGEQVGPAASASGDAAGAPGATGTSNASAASDQVAASAGEGGVAAQPASSTSADAKSVQVQAAKTGWQTEGGKKVYYDANGKKLTGSQQIDGAWYYFDAKTGAMQTGLVTVKDGGTSTSYYYAADGRRQTGEQEIKDGWYYFDTTTGAMAADRFVRLDGAYLAHGAKTVYYDKTGKMVNGEQEVDGAWYYLDAAWGGAMATDRFVYLNGAYLARGAKTVYYGSNGQMVNGEQEVSGAWYYLDGALGGARAENKFVYLDGAYLANGAKTVYYGGDGKMVTGEQEVNGAWYYLDPTKGGARAESRYVYLDGAYLANGPKTVYYGSDGKMLTGKHYIDGHWRWFDPGSGATNKAGYQTPWGCYQVSAWNVSVPNYSGNAAFSYASPSRIGVWADRWDCIETFIGRAYDYIGTSYVWDYALAPGYGIDCAGLVMQALYATGMDLGGYYTPYNHYFVSGHDHYANDMANDSGFTQVAFADRQRGDLIFYPGHVAIYLGNDMVIDSYPGDGADGVAVRSMWHYGVNYIVRRPFA